MWLLQLWQLCVVLFFLSIFCSFVHWDLVGILEAMWLLFSFYTVFSLLCIALVPDVWWSVAPMICRKYGHQSYIISLFNLTSCDYNIMLSILQFQVKHNVTWVTWQDCVHLHSQCWLCYKCQSMSASIYMCSRSHLYWFVSHFLMYNISFLCLVGHQALTSSLCWLWLRVQL